MGEVVGWIAPIATMIAAMMTAANINARVTGWGFVVFLVGSIGWTLVGLTSGQTNLIASNGFLTLVNCVGIWRWLGRQRAYEDGGRSAKTASLDSSAPTLFTATGIGTMPVIDKAGEPVGQAVEALLSCETGEISYVVVRSGGAAGIGETLRAVAKRDIRFECETLVLRLSSLQFEKIDMLEAGAWPKVAPRGSITGV